MAKPLELNESWIERITDAVTGLQYGNVQIVVHDGRIVQIERTERRRFDEVSERRAAREVPQGGTATTK
ncbi:YezD family protein [Cohnella nanjingensis]|uniref:YezD family protein n=1 Tax=Cohnella nanjingensis TaxID=1387779 RepID=A0A7X0RP53_9BACL|nr:YezD family protein [Cohnella nanjingensis]MBB6670956.1 YezD family protein [Cohnella nanjingensis]